MSEDGNTRLKVGDFDFDSKAARLFRDGQPVKIEPQPLRVFQLLIERHGEIVSREELRHHVWNGSTFVEFDQGLNYCIRQIRRALGDDASKPTYIETLPKQGYRCIADVAPEGNDERAAGLVDSPATIPAETVVLSPVVAPPQKRRSWPVLAAVCFCLGVVALVLYFTLRSHPASLPSTGLQYTQLTYFADSASAPALSPDGRMLAFIRGSNAFFATDQIYVRMLLHGETRRLTNDSRWKYGPTFTPDGSQVGYTVLDGKRFDTNLVSVLSGEPHLLRPNAAGLTWLGPEQLLFSRVPSGLHMGVVRGTLTNDHFEDLYLPAHEQGLALYSFASPDRKTALVVELGDGWNWSRCKLISLEHQFAAREVGPKGSCNAAAWSADGSWMYFTVAVKGASHLWRQAYPDGKSEQMTTGPTEEEGVVAEAGGRSLLTSLGKRESSLRLHDANGDRPLETEGEVLGWRFDEEYAPAFSPDGKFIYYLLRQQAGSEPELWRVDAVTGRKEPLFPGISMQDYDISRDNKEALYSCTPPDRPHEFCIAALDRSSPVIHVRVANAFQPHFGPAGEILFLRTEANSNYLEASKRDGSDIRRVLPHPIIDHVFLSPTREWAITGVAVPRSGPQVLAFSLKDGRSRVFCSDPCYPSWSWDGKWLLVGVEHASGTNPGRMLAIPLKQGEVVPEVPAGGIPPDAPPDIIRGARSSPGELFLEGSSLSRYAYLDTRVHRNIYRVSLP